MGVGGMGGGNGRSGVEETGIGMWDGGGWFVFFKRKTNKLNLKKNKMAQKV